MYPKTGKPLSLSQSAHFSWHLVRIHDAQQHLTAPFAVGAEVTQMAAVHLRAMTLALAWVFVKILIATRRRLTTMARAGKYL